MKDSRGWINGFEFLAQNEYVGTYGWESLHHSPLELRVRIYVATCIDKHMEWERSGDDTCIRASECTHVQMYVYPSRVGG